MTRFRDLGLNRAIELSKTFHHRRFRFVPDSCLPEHSTVAPLAKPGIEDLHVLQHLVRRHPCHVIESQATPVLVCPRDSPPPGTIPILGLRRNLRLKNPRDCRISFSVACALESARSDLYEVLVKRDIGHYCRRSRWTVAPPTDPPAPGAEHDQCRQADLLCTIPRRRMGDPYNITRLIRKSVSWPGASMDGWRRPGGPTARMSLRMLIFARRHP